METTHLQALALNFLKNIPGFLNEGVDIPTLSNCHKCNEQILSVLSCGHILHRTCIQEIIMGTEAKCPSPPPTAPIQSQSNQTNDEQGREPTPPNKLQGLITELSTPTKGESDEADENEIPDGSLSQNLARLY
ncbi:4261_t:CDS:2 [Ambispora gerdemannii]|uniref:4261_t:CDS:1 n=1 Tax=Ambispora gerdemannii TaxID=144530 RepID=A0A9N8WIQ8_9GLOM|nr:4261_t:CDS:2 [Ambispora gerdemannii]